MKFHARNLIALMAAFVMALSLAAGLLLLGNSTTGFVTFAAIFFLVLLVGSLYSTDFALYALVIVSLTEALYKGATANMFTMLAKDIFLWIMLLRLFWVSQRTKDYSWARCPLTLPAILLTVYCAAMAFAPQNRSLLLAIAGFRSWALWMPLYFPAYQIMTTRRRVFSLVTTLLLVMVPVSIYGVIQGNIGYEHTKVLPGFYSLTSWYGIAPPRPDPEGLNEETQHPRKSEDQSEGFELGFRPIMAVRACSIFISPGYFGGMAMLTTLLSLGVLGWARNPILRGLAVVAALAAVGGLLASGSRAPMVGLMVGLIAMTLSSRRRIMVTIGVIIVALGTVYMLRDIAGAGAARIERTLTVSGALQRSFQPLGFGLQAAMENPLGRGIATGQGAGRLVYSGALQLERGEGSRFIENEFGRALAELGFPGAIFWLWMVLAPLVETFRVIRRLDTQRAGVLVAAMFGVMLAIFVQLGVGAALYQGAGMFYYVFAAMARRLVELPLGETRPALARPHLKDFNLEHTHKTSSASL